MLVKPVACITVYVPGTVRQLQTGETVAASVYIPGTSQRNKPGEEFYVIAILRLCKRDKALHVSQFHTFPALTTAQVDIEAVRPPFGRKGLGHGCQCVPAGGIVILYISVRCIYHVADTPALLTVNTVHVVHPFLQVLPGTAVKAELRLILTVSQVEVYHLLGVMYGSIEFHGIAVFLAVLFPGLVLFLHTEPHTLQCYVVIHLQWHTGRNRKGERERILTHQLKVPC